MAVVTITTDFGTADFYLAALKGALLKACGNISIVDVNAQVNHFDIKQAVFSLQQAHRYFPENTVHIAHINPNFKNNRLLIAKAQSQFIIAFDNGFIPLFFGESLQEVFAVRREYCGELGINNFEIIAKVAAHLISSSNLETISEPVSDYVKMSLPKPVVGIGGIKGNIISIDSFGNAITDITREMFEANFAGKKFAVMVNRARVTAMMDNYGQHNDEGEFISLFNDAGLLEIAVSKGKASNLLGLAVSQNVIIVAE